MTTPRCTQHPAFEADYCPSCGTARVIGGTSYPSADVVEAAGFDSTGRTGRRVTWTDVHESNDLVAFIRTTFDRDEFATDPGGYLSHWDLSVDDVVAAAAIRVVVGEAS